MELREYFKNNSRAAIAFSGGVDSAYLLYAATEAGADVKAYYVKSQFQPAFEYDDAVRTAAQIGADLKVIKADVLCDETIRSNPEDRCYYCKTRIMGSILKAASEDGYDIIFDGTNASDDADDRPGFKALGEFGIKSPLRECGLTKDEIRSRAREAGLDVWNKPAYACLATRIPSGEPITARKLEITEEAEQALSEMGFVDFRVRMRGDSALIQVTDPQYDKAVSEIETIREAIGYMYSSVRLDDKTRGR